MTSLLSKACDPITKKHSAACLTPRLVFLIKIIIFPSSWTHLFCNIFSSCCPLYSHSYTFSMRLLSFLSVFLFFFLSFRLSVCRSFFLSFFPSFILSSVLCCLFVCFFVFLFVCLFLSPSFHSSVGLSAHPSFFLSLFPSFFLSLLSVFLSVYLSLFLLAVGNTDPNKLLISPAGLGRLKPITDDQVPQLLADSLRQQHGDLSNI